MARRHFLINLGRYVDIPKIKEICEIMELSKEESILLLSRYCNGHTMDQVADYPFCINRDKQYKLSISLEQKIIGWYIRHKDFFTSKQRDILDQFVDFN